MSRAGIPVIDLTDARRPGEPRSFEPANEDPSVAETMALAMLRFGMSFAQAAEKSGVSMERVMRLWAQKWRRN